MVHAGGRHHWSLINDNFDIAVETTQDLGSPFAWAPPLSTEPRDADDLLAGLDSILLDDIAVKFAALKEFTRMKSMRTLMELKFSRKVFLILANWIGLNVE